MDQNDIPAEVRQYILANIPTIPHMEALMLIRAAAPARWSAGTLARRLYVSQQVAGAVLADLSRAGMLRHDEEAGAFRYPDTADALTDVIDQLAVLYGTHLVEVTWLIHSRRA